jgi:endonuclease/exonuclease/phosphatase family metal-dependent hydrolase
VLFRQRLTRVFYRITAFGLVAIIAAGLLGQVIRDRSVPFAVLMYLPVLPACVAAVAMDLAGKGRALPRLRFALALLGISGGIWVVLTMVGSGAIGKFELTDTEVTLLQWNVMWGGGPFRSPRTWAAQRAEITGRDPDIVILSELPPAAWLEQLVDEMGPGADVVGIQHDPLSPYWFRLAVCSRWPVRLDERIPLPGGVGMSVTVTVRDRPFRLLVVDGKSNPFHSRLPFVRAIAELCRAAEQDGHPFNAVAGDFNTPSRSIGFDAMRAQGYTLAGLSAAGWRGTFPAWLPIYDIDHVWVNPGLRVRSTTLFNGPFSDHRGQFISALRAKPEASTDHVRRSFKTQ